MWLGVSAGVGLRVLGPSHISIASGPSVLPKPKLCSQISTSLVKARSWPTSMKISCRQSHAFVSLSSCERKTSVSTLSLSPSLFSRTSTREMVLAQISERSRSAPLYRRPSAPLLSPGTSDLHFSFEIRVFCKESRELSWEFHWSFTSLCLACLLRHDSGSYSSSTVTLHLFCEPRYELTSPHPSACFRSTLICSI